MAQTVYEIVTDRIIAQLEKGCVPWQKPWTSNGPRNLVSKKAYRGVNVLLLADTSFSSPWWLTFKQAKQLGGTVRKGEKSTIVVFWKMLAKKQTKEQQEKGTKAGFIPMLRYFRVFNSEQCDGLKIPAEDQKAVNPIQDCESLVSSMPYAPKIEHGGDRACYSPSPDRVKMPVRNSFNSPEGYYSTMFHELVHSTGHKSRLDRGFSADPQPFGSEDYSKEELVAEVGAAMLCGVVGIENTISNSAAYLKSWLGALRNDSKLIVCAAAKAQKAADCIRGITFENAS